jgi:hypothetical protein
VALVRQRRERDRDPPRGRDGAKSIFIAGGAFDECIGLRFQLNGIPNGAHIESVVLTMWHLPEVFRDVQGMATRVKDNPQPSSFATGAVKCSLHQKLIWPWILWTLLSGSVSLGIWPGRRPTRSP